MDLSGLKKKELGLPLWAWALIVGVLMFLLYRHYKGSGSAGTGLPADSTAGVSSPLDSGGGGGGDIGGGGSSQGGAVDTSGLLASAQGALDAQQAYYTDLLGQVQGNPDSTDPNGGNPTPTPTASTGGLSWGGQNYTTRAGFNAYLKSKGLSVKQFALRHPAAYAEYLGLPTGVTKTHTAKSSVLNSAKGAIKGGISKTIKPGYQTFKKNVNLRAGQTVHFQEGKGYYAAPGSAHPVTSRPTYSRPLTRQPIQTRYYTYKTQVRLGQGQTLHYTRGRGYYGR